MKKDFVFVLFSLLVQLSVFAQQSNLILTYEQNNKWLDSLNKSSLKDQIVMLNQRLLADTGVYSRNYYADRIIIKEPIGNRVYGDGKPWLVVGYFEDRPKSFADSLVFWQPGKDCLIMLNNQTKPDKIKSLTKLISSTQVLQIKVDMPSVPLSALYGSRAQNGIVVLALRSKKYQRLFEKLGLK